MWRSEDVAYSDHALKRMEQRRISKSQVLSTLNHPDRTYPSRDKLVAERQTGTGNTLRVFYLDRPEGPLIASVLRLSGSRSGR